jgi:hypothetical protein
MTGPASVMKIPAVFMAAIFVAWMWLDAVYDPCIAKPCQTAGAHWIKGPAVKPSPAP